MLSSDGLVMIESLDLSPGAARSPEASFAPVALDRQLLRGDMLSSDELVMMESLDLSPGVARSPEASFFGGNAVSLPAGWSAEMSVDGTVTHWMNSLTGETTETFPTCAVYDEFELEDLEDSRSVDILSSVDDIDVSQSVADVVTPRAMAASPEHGPDVSPIAPQEEWPPKLVMPDKEARAKLFRELDVNGNDGLSLAEIDKAVVGGTLGRALQYPDFNHKPALMRAYKAADVSGDGFIEQREFVQLLGYLVYFNNLWAKFDAIDRNHDRRLDATEFAAGCKVIGMQLTPEEAQSAFAQCDRDGTGKVLFEDFCTWCAKRDGSDSSQATPRLKTKLSEHKRRVGTSPARTAKSPRAHGKQGISRTPQGSGLSRSTSASNSGDGGRSTRNLHEPEDSQRRSPARAPRGSETDRVSPQRSHGVAPRGVLPASSSDSASRRRSSYRKSSQARISASAKASAERLSSPRRSWQSPAKFDNRVVRHARTPPRDAPGHQIAAIPFLRRSGGEIFVSSKDREAPPRPGGFNAKLTKAEMTAGIPVRNLSATQIGHPLSMLCAARHLLYVKLTSDHHPLRSDRRGSALFWIRTNSRRVVFPAYRLTTLRRTSTYRRRPAERLLSGWHKRSSMVKMRTVCWLTPTTRTRTSTMPRTVQRVRGRLLLFPRKANARRAQSQSGTLTRLRRNTYPWTQLPRRTFVTSAVYLFSSAHRNCADPVETVTTSSGTCTA